MESIPGSLHVYKFGPWSSEGIHGLEKTMKSAEYYFWNLLAFLRVLVILRLEQIDDRISFFRPTIFFIDF